jgi:hypothetical protein
MVIVLWDKNRDDVRGRNEMKREVERERGE